MNYEVAEALPSPEVLFTPALFEVGAQVQSVPDTAPGIPPEHSIAIYGTVAEVKAEECWWYRIKSMHSERNKVWVPEHRVLEISRSLYDNTRRH